MTTRQREITPEGKAVRHTLSVRHRRTSYIRFAAWAYTDAAANPGGPETMGYSNIAASTITTDNCPRNVEATYRRSTVTVSNDCKLLDGTLEIGATWADDASCGTVELAIRDMRADSGGARLTIRGTEVGRIECQDSSHRNGETFSSLTRSRVVSVSGAEQSSADLTTEHSGQFIGASLDGPVAVLCEWRVAVCTFTIDGHFGSDVVPAP